MGQLPGVGGWGERPSLAGGHPGGPDHPKEGGRQKLAPLPTAQPLCPSPSSACWRTTTLTGALPALCCPWAPPSTWMAPRSTRLWPPSSLPRSTTMNWISARSSPSGTLLTPHTQCVLGVGCTGNAFRILELREGGWGEGSRPRGRPHMPA